MVSIYANYLASKPSFHYAASSDQRSKQVLDLLAILKLFVRNGELATKNFLEGRLSKFDPSVRDHACQTRPGFLLDNFNDQKLKEELIAFKQLIMKIKSVLQKNMSKTPVLDLSGNLEKVIKDLGLDIRVSEKIAFLFEIHFLTQGRIFVTSQEGVLSTRVHPIALREKLNSKSADLNQVKEIIETTREKITKNSVVFIHEVANKINIKKLTENGALIEEELKPSRVKVISFTPEDSRTLTFHVACNYYTFLTTLLLAFEKQMMIVLEVGQDQKHYFSVKKEGKPQLLSDDEVKRQSALEPLLVIKGYGGKNTSKSESDDSLSPDRILDTLKANAACIPQFHDGDDISCLSETAQKEIGYYRDLGKKAQCQTVKSEIFSIIHVSAATFGELNPELFLKTKSKKGEEMTNVT